MKTIESKRLIWFVTESVNFGYANAPYGSAKVKKRYIRGSDLVYADKGEDA